MVGSTDIKKFIELYKDFLHSNPNIYYQAIFLLKKDFKVQFMNNLLNNLKEDDLILRRKSILALGEYGEEVLKLIVNLYLNTNNNTIKVSCLKTIIKVIVNFNLKQLSPDVMSVVDSALKDNSPEIILSVISLLRQLGLKGKYLLMKTCRDKDLLKAKASISALLEMKDQDVDDLFNELLNDKSIDPMVKEDILREKMI
tara:strand:+ start:6 stop:602 length:597 start_codon:yes stop_codon:yes gene_type:complete